MDGSTVPEVIGTHCDHRGCSAPIRVFVHLTSGELGFCMHHWVSVEEAVVDSGAFVKAEAIERELAAV
jgi:hypothetical protein